MATRYRWFRVRIPLTNGTIRDAIERLRFRPDTPHGFMTLEVAGLSSQNYRFLWRTRVPVVAMDNDGATSTQFVDGIEFTDFGISSVDGVHFLRVENPSRSARELLNCLETALGFGFTADPVKFDKQKPTTLFASVSASKLVGLKVVGALHGDGVVARMEFASKEGMDPAQLQVLSSLEYRVDSAVYEVFFHGARGQVSFAANGLVKVSSQLAAKIVNLIESDLPRLSA